MTKRRRILFFAEPVTLAHVVRPLTLAKQLDPQHFEVILATGGAYQLLIGQQPFPVRPLLSISSEQFLHNLAKGRPLYPYDTLRMYVEEDLRHISEVRPDVVVGDFRISLSVSARLARIPYVGLSNAYWSPYAHPTYQIPTHPTVGILGLPLANAAFKLIRPLVFACHAVPMHRLRRHYGLPMTGLDLHHVYTDADITAYADIPEIVPFSTPAPSNHVFLGAITWSPAVPLPAWWDQIGESRPLVYVYMGSSGDQGLLGSIIEALGRIHCCAAVATGRSFLLTKPPTNVYLSEYLPGDRVASRAALVICNGGSPTCQQGLEKGVPVLGLPSNLDQYLNMHYVATFGAGTYIRADRASIALIQEAISKMLNRSCYARRAMLAAEAFGSYKAVERLASLVRQF